MYRRPPAEDGAAGVSCAGPNLVSWLCGAGAGGLGWWMDLVGWG